MRLRNAYIHPLLNGFILLLAIWLLGLLLFAHDVSTIAEGEAKNAGRADGIVVLTGGAVRVPAGLALLKAGAAPRLLISGVDPRASIDKYFGNARLPARLRECCITLGSYAADTPGNASEAAAWARKYGLKSLFVVTANYHLRRALLEFSLALPEASLIPFAVTPPGVEAAHWSDYPGTASLFMEEYNKLLFSYVKAGLWRLFKS
jgi:uncharacterized SAM-binding protein YcdF (DUF218 family)